jgi:hypothetical protein
MYYQINRNVTEVVSCSIKGNKQTMYIKIRGWCDYETNYIGVKELVNSVERVSHNNNIYLKD